MTSGYVIGYDAIRSNVGALPSGAQVYAGYSTGTGSVPWTEAEFAAHATAAGPCLRICQDYAASDPTADYADYERGTMPLSRLAGWVAEAQAAFHAGARPGQRWPGVYQSASDVTPVVNALAAAGITSGVPLIVANWSLTEPQAIAGVMAAAGPFPVVGVQISDPGLFDVNVFSRDWLRNQSMKPAPAPRPAPAPAPAPKPVLEDEMPAGVLMTAPGVRETCGWGGGVAAQIVLHADWEGVQAEPPVVMVRLLHLSQPVTEVGNVTVNRTAVVEIPDPGNCNGVSLERADSGAAGVGWHTNPPA